MIPLLPKWHLMPNRPSFYDTDSKTLLELASVLHSSMNDLIEDYNKFVENTNTSITEFMESTEQIQGVFAVAIRQEFQDFINVVDMKLSAMQNNLDDAVGKIEQTTSTIVNNAIKEGKITVSVAYNPETEEVNIIANGGV